MSVEGSSWAVSSWSAALYPAALLFFDTTSSIYLANPWYESSLSLSLSLSLSFSVSLSHLLVAYDEYTRRIDHQQAIISTITFYIFPTRTTRNISCYWSGVIDSRQLEDSVTYGFFTIANSIPLNFTFSGFHSWNIPSGSLTFQTWLYFIGRCIAARRH